MLLIEWVDKEVEFIHIQKDHFGDKSFRQAIVLVPTTKWQQYISPATYLRSLSYNIHVTNIIIIIIIIIITNIQLHLYHVM